MNDLTEKRVDRNALFIGLVLIGFGALLLLDRLQIAEFRFLVRNFWALIPGAFGLWKVIQGRIWSGLWLMVISAWLLLSHLRLFGMSYRSSWPLLLIARTVYETARGSEPGEPS